MYNFYLRFVSARKRFSKSSERLRIARSDLEEFMTMNKTTIRTIDPYTDQIWTAVKAVISSRLIVTIMGIGSAVDKAALDDSDRIFLRIQGQPDRWYQLYSVQMFFGRSEIPVFHCHKMDVVFFGGGTIFFEG